MLLLKLEHVSLFKVNNGEGNLKNLFHMLVVEVRKSFAFFYIYMYVCFFPRRISVGNTDWQAKILEEDINWKGIILTVWKLVSSSPFKWWVK